MVDQFKTDNNCGFNLANFKPRLIRDFYGEVVADYERSFIGAFSQALFTYPVIASDEAQFDVYLTIEKFINNCGFSLTQNTK